MSDKTANQDNDYKYLYEKVGECVSGIHFLKWMFGILTGVIIALFSISFQVNSKKFNTLYTHLEESRYISPFNAGGGVVKGKGKEKEKEKAIKREVDSIAEQKKESVRPKMVDRTIASESKPVE